MTESVTPAERVITVESTSMSYPGTDQPLAVLEGVSLHVDRGEFVSILGPSGCGKSSLFSLLTGIERSDAGTMSIDGRPPGADGHRPVAWMPQTDVLLPWRTVEQNVALGLEVTGTPRRAAREIARGLLPTFGLEQFANRRPYQLSGGMRQRAALARTVALGKSILLLDEPFGALDALTRTELQLWLERIWEQNRWTVLLITHDVREAVLLSDRIYVLGPRPASVRLELEVPLPRPRTLDTLSDPRVAALERTLLEALDIGRS